jgi:hypothetical protein
MATFSVAATGRSLTLNAVYVNTEHKIFLRVCQPKYSRKFIATDDDKSTIQFNGEAAIPTFPS